MPTGKRNFDVPVKSSNKRQQELQWWLDNIDSIAKPIALSLIDLEYNCDSSSCPWGANFTSYRTCGAWNI